MSEQKQTSAEIKEQIKKAQEDLKNSSLPLTGMLAGEVNANSTPDKADVKPEPEKAAKGVETPQSHKSKDDVDYEEWAKKKGIDWTTDESVLKALHMSDQQYHEKRAKEKLAEPANQPGYTPPAYNPPPPTYVPQPAYVPPPANNRAMLENIARQYNMTIEDAEKLIAFNKDFFDASYARERQYYEQKFAVVERENQKNSVFRELASDPAFRTPQVAVEFHKTLEEMQASDPKSFEDPKQYMRAYDKSLANIARRNLMGQPLEEGTPLTAKPPTNPPRRLNGASGGGSQENENGMTSDQFARLPLEDKAKYLQSLGLRPGNG